MNWLTHELSGFRLLVLAFGGLLLFLYGFFPLKYYSGTLSKWDDLPNFIDDISIDGQEVYNPGKKSVILMVVDALRYDFVTEEYMPYTAQLLKNKSACIYISLAEPPTVTMPRIKSPERKKEKAQWRRTINFWRDIFAMMTGSVSTFADVALNFGAPAVNGDSVLRVASSRGRRSVMYGDDTWLRLFPGLWAEYDGTTSFYVSDYTEVDNNVTRHLDRILQPDEKNQPLFDFLVLHYLGLDHIGHLEGAHSPKIKPKLLEMDEIVKKIVKAMEKWDRSGVLLVCGDHGMRDAGGHGGSSPAELLVPLVVAKSDDIECPHDYREAPIVAQVDIASSVSWLLHAQFPQDNTGRVLPALLPLDTLQHLYLLHYTAKHNAHVVLTQFGEQAMEKEFYKQFKRAEKQFAQYLASGQKTAAKLAKEFYDESLSKMSDYLTKSTVTFNMFAIVVAVCLLVMIFLALLMVTLYSLQNEIKRKYSITAHGRNRTRAGAVVAFFFISICIFGFLILACAVSETNSSFCSINSPWLLALIATSMVSAKTFFIIKSGIEENMHLSILKGLNGIDYLLIGGTVLHSLTFLGTSFIEEEHLTWHFFWNTLMFFICVRTFAVIVSYFVKRSEGATEIQDKPGLYKKMNAMGTELLPAWVLLIALHRFLRTMNQTGDRWAFLPDTADWLNEPENSFYLQTILVIGTILTFIICLWNIRFTNNVMQMNSALTTVAIACILIYRMATSALYTPFPIIKTWDTVHIVNVFWGLLIAEFIYEILTFIGIFRNCIKNDYGMSNDSFIYHKPKAKIEDSQYHLLVDEPWNSDDVKLKLSQSLSHILLNNMMLVIILLMRPHNVIMVPGVYFTCVLTSKCMNHTLLDSRPGRKTEVLDTLSQSLVYTWIGTLFFFYQGNSNSLASVDLSAGYVGLREYCPVSVATRMAVHTYAGPALAGMTLFCTHASSATNWDQYIKSVWRCINIISLLRVYALTVYVCIATGFRHHLFVWTVFSPKLLYEFVATIFAIGGLSTVIGICALTHLTSLAARAITYRTNL